MTGLPPLNYFVLCGIAHGSDMIESDGSRFAANE
jgi:hypothetical protein